MRIANRAGVYEIVSPSGGRYIGSSKNVADRLCGHKIDLRKGRHANIRLQQAWNKYARDAFIFKPLLYCSEKEILFYEQRCLDILQPSYNILQVAGRPLGYNHTTEAREKISKALTGVSHTKERRKTNSLAQKGRKQSDETRLKRSLSMKGRPKSAEHRVKIKASSQNRTLEVKAKLSRIAKERNFGQHFSSSNIRRRKKCD